MIDFDFLSVRGIAVSVVSFATIIFATLSLKQGRYDVVWQDQTMPYRETTVSVALMHFIFA